MRSKNKKNRFEKEGLKNVDYSNQRMVKECSEMAN